MSFYSLYDSFETFFNSFFHGNEIEFIYNDEHFFILPLYDSNQNVVGVEFGQSNCEEAQKCFSQKELFNVTIDGKLFGKLVEYIKIIWNNF